MTHPSSAAPSRSSAPISNGNPLIGWMRERNSMMRSPATSPCSALIRSAFPRSVIQRSGIPFGMTAIGAVSPYSRRRLASPALFAISDDASRRLVPSYVASASRFFQLDRPSAAGSNDPADPRRPAGGTATATRSLLARASARCHAGARRPSVPRIGADRALHRPAVAECGDRWKALHQQVVESELRLCLPQRLRSVLRPDTGVHPELALAARAMPSVSIPSPPAVGCTEGVRCRTRISGCALARRSRPCLAARADWPNGPHQHEADRQDDPGHHAGERPGDQASRVGVHGSVGPLDQRDDGHVARRACRHAFVFRHGRTKAPRARGDIAGQPCRLALCCNAGAALGPHGCCGGTRGAAPPPLPARFDPLQVWFGDPTFRRCLGRAVGGIVLVEQVEEPRVDVASELRVPIRDGHVHPRRWVHPDWQPRVDEACRWRSPSPRQALGLRHRARRACRSPTWRSSRRRMDSPPPTARTQQRQIELRISGVSWRLHGRDPTPQSRCRRTGGNDHER